MLNIRLIATVGFLLLLHYILRYQYMSLQIKIEIVIDMYGKLGNLNLMLNVK